MRDREQMWSWSSRTGPCAGRREGAAPSASSSVPIAQRRDGGSSGAAQTSRSSSWAPDKGGKLCRCRWPCGESQQRRRLPAECGAVRRAVQVRGRRGDGAGRGDGARRGGTCGPALRALSGHRGWRGEGVQL